MKEFFALIIPLYVAAPLASGGCSPAADQYTAEQAACVTSAHSRESADACRRMVREKWGFNPDGGK